jgi:hypothetical protein
MRGARWIAEHRIVDAQRRGEFDALPNHGKPLPDDALVGLDEETRSDAVIQRAVGAASLEVMLMRQLADMREALRALPDGPERDELAQKVRDLSVRVSVLHEVNGHRLLAHPERVRLP